MLSRYAPEYSSKVRGFSPGAIVAIKRYRWPGNIRELENRIKKAVVLADRTMLGPDDLGINPDEIPTILPLADARERWQRSYINEVLGLNGGNRTKTARDLGVDPRTIFRHLEKEEGSEGSDALPPLDEP
jgi:DNA-binding NtrC family response regulator